MQCGEDDVMIDTVVQCDATSKVGAVEKQGK
jgi:hypothetical protein